MPPELFLELVEVIVICGLLRHLRTVLLLVRVLRVLSLLLLLHLIDVEPVVLNEVDGVVLRHELRRQIFLAFLICQQFLLRLFSRLDVFDFRLDAEIDFRNSIQHLIREHFLGLFR